MKKEIKETRRIHSDSVRQLCIDRNYYTKGTNTQYLYLLEVLCAVENTIGTKELQGIAENIISHTDTSAFYGSDEEPIYTVMWELAKYCCFSCFS